MTAVREQAKTPPRFLIRTFWTLHRSAYRLTGGRFGLKQPEAGERFGFMRLHTVGRRSGKARVAIIGYYEDGPNLVTLAMNGWGQAEPAWWLNLQAAPEATVQLVDGPRAVRARVATSDERERLWPKFAEYPGWGDDLEALAANRPGQTAVVVLEPRLDARPTVRADTMDQIHTGSAAGDQRAATASQPVGRSRRLRPRHLWILPGLGLALFANQQATQLGIGLVPVLAFGIGPDLPRLVGIRGPRMTALHNAAHHPGLALALVLVSFATGLSPFAYVGAISWLSHIVLGWGIDDRMRVAQGLGTAGSRSLRLGGLLPGSAAARTSPR
jgi:deazaflavin-dependent oxidoreductase (nitroreductase family)